MTALSGKSARGRPGRAWVRHVTAVTAAIVLNGALVLFLVTWRARAGQAPAAPITAMPVRVVDAELEHADPIEPEPIERIVLAGPIQELPLPAIPAPRLPAAASQMDAPAVLEMPVGPSYSTDVPVYVSESPQPAVGAVSPGGVAPSGATPGAKAHGIATSRGPVMIRPPNLSDYYPRRARMRGTTGKTTLRLTIDAGGKVLGVEVVTSTPEGVFETAGRRVGRSLAFQPALRDNRPVRAVVRLNLVWRLE